MISVAFSPLGDARRRGGFTLPEMLLVLLVVAALGALLIPQLTGRLGRSKDTITSVSLRRLRQVIVESYRDDMFERLPYPNDIARQQHPQLHYLFVNPAAGPADPPELWTYDPARMRGWSGPYVNEPGTYVVNVDRGFTALYGESGDSAPLDAWGNPIVLQQPIATSGVHSPASLQAARLVSAGPNGVLETPPASLAPTIAEQGDDLVLYFKPN